jgi:hypothetical protein
VGRNHNDFPLITPTKGTATESKKQHRGAAPQSPNKKNRDKEQTPESRVQKLPMKQAIEILIRT